jgi:hypothetical protein
MNFIKTNLIYFWTIGKLVYEKRQIYDNIIERSSNYFSYYFGNSTLFTRDNIKYMEMFYLNFPIYYSKLNNITWDQYKLLFTIENREERYFYFYLSLFFNSNLDETKDFISNNYYVRI